MGHTKSSVWPILTQEGNRPIWPNNIIVGLFRTVIKYSPRVRTWNAGLLDDDDDGIGMAAYYPPPPNHYQYYEPPPPPGAAHAPPPAVPHQQYLPPQSQFLTYAPPLYPQSSNGEVRTLFVAGLPEDVKAREIYNLFREFPGYESSHLRTTASTQVHFINYFFFYNSVI